MKRTKLTKMVGYLDSFKLTEIVEKGFEIELCREAYDRTLEDVRKIL